MNDIAKYKKKMAASLKAEMAPSIRKGIVLLRSGTATPLNGPGDSYFGGLPRLPPDLEWPQLDLDSPDGEPLLLSFVAQIRLDDLPHVPGREALPSTGTLYFFQVDPSHDGESLECRVLFHPGCERFPERAAPDNLPRLRAYESLGLPTECWRSVEFRYPITFAVADTYLDREDLGSYDCVQRQPDNDQAAQAAELLLEEFRAQALTQALGPPPRAKYEVTGGCHHHSRSVQAVEDAAAWVALQESLPGASGMPRATDDVALCCFYANLCCQLGQRNKVPARWIELLEEWAAWVDRNDAERPFTQNWFEMHQMLGNWKHHHCQFHQDPNDSDEVLLLQIGGSKQLVFNPDLTSVLHFVISADALTHRDFSEVVLYT